MPPSPPKTPIDDDEEEVEAETKEALELLELGALPKTAAEVDTAARKVLRKTHPDRFNDPRAKEVTQKILNARAKLKAMI